MKQSMAKILNENRGALDVTAAAARISTQEGTAREIYARSGDREKDLKLVGKVLSSGHQSVVEHQTFSIAFNDVSVLAEQFIIEFRLASFTVKSRRYVDFSKAGYVADDGLSGEAAQLYAGRAEALFGDYERLLALGVPKEDARFLLPYCLRSNFFATMNARELVRMIQAMRFGRGARFAELRGLGEQLSAQLDALYPGVFSFGPMDEAVAPTAQPLIFAKGEPAKGGAELLAAPGAAEKLLAAAMDFSGRWPQGYSAQSVRALIRDSRPRELEVLNYTFRVSDVSLACVTHFTRHRMQSLMVPDVIRAQAAGERRVRSGQRGRSPGGHFPQYLLQIQGSHHRALRAEHRPQGHADADADPRGGQSLPRAQRGLGLWREHLDHHPEPAAARHGQHHDLAGHQQNGSRHRAAHRRPSAPRGRGEGAPAGSGIGLFRACA